MANAYLLELDSVQEQINAELEAAYGPAKDKAERESHTKRYSSTKALLSELLRPGADHHSLPKIAFSEAVRTNDFKILFPKAVELALQRAKEGPYIGQSLLAKTIRVDGASYATFPTALGGMVAMELGETQEPPEQKGSFRQDSMAIRTKRYGLKIEFANDVIERSQWDIVSMYLEEAGKALARKREELIFNEYEATAFTRFDNESVDTSKHTGGKASNGTSKNATFSYFDLIDMIATLGANGGHASHVLIHPLTQLIWLQDPFLRFQLLHRGAVGQTLQAPTYDADGQPTNVDQYMPFGLQTVVTPFQTIAYADTLTSGVTGQAACNTTTISVVDSDSKILIMEQRAARMAKYENVLRDIQGMLLDEKYGMLLLDGGRTAVQAKNVRIDRNYEPSYSITTVAAA